MKTYQQISSLIGIAIFTILIFAGILWHVSGTIAAAPMVYGDSVVDAPVVLLADDTEEIFRVPARQGTSPTVINAATISITYVLTGSVDHYNEPCYDWPQGSKDAFEHAALLWAMELNSTVPIVIEACWANLPPGALGYSGSSSRRNFPNAPFADTFYKYALANALAGSDLNGGTPEMYITYNGNGISWYFGTDGLTPSGQYDFVSVVLHEICHGLNFAGRMEVSGGLGGWGSYPGIYDRFTENDMGDVLLSFPNNSSELAVQLTSDSIYFNGTNTNAANGGSSARLYAPDPWEEGSSYSHLHDDYDRTVNALMTHSLRRGTSLHDPGPVARGMLLDMGWTLSLVPTVTPAFSPTPTSTNTPTITVSPTVTPTAPPTTTSTLHPNTTQTPSATACPTLDGYVRLGNSTGPGLPDVRILGDVVATLSVVATTDSSGYFVEEVCVDSMLYWPEKNNYYFVPQGRTYDKDGHGNVGDFVAFPITDTLTSPVFLPLIKR